MKMKYIAALCLALCLVFCLALCFLVVCVERVQIVEVAAHTESIPATQSPTTNITPTESQTSDETEKTVLPNTDPTEWQIYYNVEGTFVASGGSGRAMLYAEKCSMDTAPTFLAVLQEDMLLTFNLGNLDVDVLGFGDLYAADVDQDGLDEIIYSGVVSGLGARSISLICKVIDDQIVLMEDINGARNDYATSKYGCAYSYLEGRQLEIRNDNVGFRAVQDISGYDNVFHFDEKGLPQPSYVLYFDIGHTRTIVETVGGAVRLKYMQYLKIDGPTWCGYVETTLQYDPDSKKLEAVAADYVAGSDADFRWELW